MARAGRCTPEVMHPPNEAKPQMQNVADRRGIAELRDVAGEAAGNESDCLLDHGWWAGYSLCSTRAGGFRVAVSPGRAAITAAAASQLAAMMDSTAAGTATTGVMPS